METDPSSNFDIYRYTAKSLCVITITPVALLQMFWQGVVYFTTLMLEAFGHQQKITLFNERDPSCFMPEEIIPM